MATDWNQILRSAVTPGLYGAVGLGGASGIASALSSRKPGETGREKRRRVIRNTALGAGLGGLAGAALPTGAKMLSDVVSTPPPPSSGIANWALPAAGLSTGAATAGWVANSDKQRAVQSIFRQLSEPSGKTTKITGLGSAGDIADPAHLIAKLRGNPSLVVDLYSRLSAKGVAGGAADPVARIRAIEALRAAGIRLPENLDSRLQYSRPSDVQALRAHFRQGANPITSGLFGSRPGLGHNRALQGAGWESGGRRSPLASFLDKRRTAAGNANPKTRLGRLHGSMAKPIAALQNLINATNPDQLEGKQRKLFSRIDQVGKGTEAVAKFRQLIDKAKFTGGKAYSRLMRPSMAAKMPPAFRALMLGGGLAGGYGLSKL